MGREEPTLVRLCALFLVPCLAIACAGQAAAQEARSFRLHADPEVVASGLLDYLRPRFSLKTGRQVELAESGADLLIVRVAAPPALFARDTHLFDVETVTENPAAAKFAEWIASDAGMAAVMAFVPEEGAAYAAAPAVASDPVPEIEGDAGLGRKVSDEACRRCHRVSPDGRNIGIGSTPSFMALRALPDWQERFSTFYVRNPHPAFVQVEGISPAFDAARPPPIAPVRLQPGDIDAILAYVAAMAPADLGAPVVHQ